MLQVAILSVQTLKREGDYKIVSTVAVYHVHNSALFDALCGTSQ